MVCKMPHFYKPIIVFWCIKYCNFIEKCIHMLPAGSLTANGMSVDPRSFRKETGYVMQSDALFPLLTVRETMRYAAYLRVQDKTVEEKNALADSIISLLRLEKVADTIVGDDDNRGLSGGEKRRVSWVITYNRFIV